MLPDAILSPLIAGASGLVGTLATAAIAWARDRGASARRQRLLDEETKRLAFWEAWLRVQTSAPISENDLSEIQRRVLNEAHASSANVQAAFQQPTGRNPVTGKQPILAALLSLFFPGFGQVYNADSKKGLTMVAAYIFSLALSSTGIGLLAILPIWLWSTIDAYRVASGKGRRWSRIASQQ